MMKILLCSTGPLKASHTGYTCSCFMKQSETCTIWMGIIFSVGERSISWFLVWLLSQSLAAIYYTKSFSATFQSREDSEPSNNGATKVFGVLQILASTVPVIYGTFSPKGSWGNGLNLWVSPSTSGTLRSYTFFCRSCFLNISVVVTFVVSLVSGIALPKDGESALKDSTDKKGGSFMSWNNGLHH